MALINCPACSARVSSRAETCSNCNAPIANRNDEASERALARARWNKRKRLQNLAFLSIVSFMVGVGLLWSLRGEPDSWSFKTGVWLSAAGFFGYAILRIKGIMDKFK